MPNVVRAALVQSEWTGDKESMIVKNIEYARQAAAQGAQILCFQEIFSGPYFCTEQRNEHFDTAEPIPDGPTISKMIELAKETGMVLVVPIFEVEDTGHYYNTAAVIDSDGTFLGKYRKTHIPQVAGFWEKFYFRPGNLGYPVFDTAVGRVGVYICYDRHFPEGWRVPKSCSTPRLPLAAIPSICGSWSNRRRRSPTSTSWGRSTGSEARTWKTPTTTGAPISLPLVARLSEGPAPTSPTTW